MLNGLIRSRSAGGGNIALARTPTTLPPTTYRLPATSYPSYPLSGRIQMLR